MRGASSECHSAGLAPKRASKTLQEGGGQRDFRQEDQHLPAAPERLGDRLEIDFGLAGSGDAIDQGHLEAALLRRCADHAGGARLARIEAHRPVIWIGWRDDRRRRHEGGFEHALGGEPVDDAG